MQTHLWVNLLSFKHKKILSGVTDKYRLQRRNDDGSLIRQIFLKEKPNTSRMHFEILRGYFTSRINTSEKKFKTKRKRENKFIYKWWSLLWPPMIKRGQLRQIGWTLPAQFACSAVVYNTEKHVRPGTQIKPCASWNTKYY